MFVCQNAAPRFLIHATGACNKLGRVPRVKVHNRLRVRNDKIILGRIRKIKHIYSNSKFTTFRKYHTENG